MHIGTWAEIALVNLKKILNTVSNQEESSEEGGSARKRMCIRVCRIMNYLGIKNPAIHTCTLYKLNGYMHVA